MSNYDIIYLGEKAEELGFVRDTLEKVTRLADISERTAGTSKCKSMLNYRGGKHIII